MAARRARKTQPVRDNPVQPEPEKPASPLAVIRNILNDGRGDPGHKLDRIRAVVEGA